MGTIFSSLENKEWKLVEQKKKFMVCKENFIPNKGMMNS